MLFPRNKTIVKLSVTLGCGAFIVFFLLLFKPFNTDTSSLANICLFGLVTAITCTFYYVFLPLILSRFGIFIDDFRPRWWLDGLNIITIGSLNFFLGTLVEDNVTCTWGWYFTYLFYTLAIGVIISVMVYFFVNNYMLKKKLQEIEAINQQLINKLSTTETDNKEITFEGETRNEQLTLRATDLLYVKAEGNYCLFCFFKDGKTATRLIRITLKGVDAMLGESEYFMRCHRSYIVNTKKVVKIGSTGSNYQIWMSNVEDVIPASRQNIQDLKNSIGLIA